MREPYTIDRHHPSPGFRETLAALGLLFCLCGLACLWLLPAGVGIVGVILCAEAGPGVGGRSRWLGEQHV